MITEVRPIAVVFTLPQQQLAQVNAASARGPVTVEALDADGKTVLDRGTLQVVDNQVDQTTGTVRMKAEFPNANLQLWPGQFVNVRVLIDTLQQVVVVPTPAVQRGPNGTFAYVVQADQRVALRPITVGLQTETTAVITKGIDATDRVVTTGFARLKDGARVSVMRGEDQPAAGGESGKGAAPAPSAKSDAREKIRTACAADAQKLCPNVERGSALRTCLQANAAQLSEPCKAASSGGAAGRQAARGRRAQGRRKLDAMSVSSPFIKRPIATSLLGFAVTLGGALGYWLLPVSSLPQVDFPTIQVTTQLPGANPETTANLVTAPLERQLGQIPALATMTSSSSYGISQITLQFKLNRDIDAAAQDVQSAINAAGSTLPRNLPYPPTYAKVNPADAPIVTLALTSATISLRELSDLADTLMAQRLSSVPGVGHVSVEGGIRPAVRIQADLSRLASYGLSMADLRTAIAAANVSGPKGSLDGAHQSYTIAANDQISSAEAYRDRDRRLSQRRAGAAQGRGRGHRRAGERQRRRLVPGHARRHHRRAAPARRQRHRDGQSASRRSCRGCSGPCRATSSSPSCTTAPAPSAPPSTTCSSRWCSASRWSSWWCCCSCAPSAPPSSPAWRCRCR